MKNILRKTLVATAAVLSFGAAQAVDNTLTFQGVTFQTTVVDSDTLSLNILNALNATGDWTGIGFISAFEIKGVGDITSASLAGWTSTVENGLNANGCIAGDDKGACFTHTPALALTNDMTFTMDLVGNNLNLFTPTLKVRFLTNQDDVDKTGSLLSMEIPAIPEPETYALMLAGLGVIGFLARRRRPV
jgi:hypothetical protein